MLDLLEAHDGAGGFLYNPGKTPTTANPSGLGGVPVLEKPRDTIGRHRLLEQIGEGGCGVVDLAEQQKPVRRRVALKIIKLGMDTRQFSHYCAAFLNSWVGISPVIPTGQCAPGILIITG